MALRRDFSHLLPELFKLSNRCLKNCRISSSPVLGAGTFADSNKAGIPPPDHGYKRFFLFGQEIGTLKSAGLDRERTQPDPARLTADDVKKMLHTAQLEAVKCKLREVGKTWIPHSEYIRICGQGISDPDNVHRLAKSLDESGTVIIVGNVVVHRPEQDGVGRNGEGERRNGLQGGITGSARAMVRTRFPYSADIGMHEAYFLGAFMGCNGAYLLLPHLDLLHGRLRFLPCHYPRAFLCKLLSKQIEFQADPIDQAS